MYPPKSGSWLLSPLVLIVLSFLGCALFKAGSLVGQAHDIKQSILLVTDTPLTVTDVTSSPALESITPVTSVNVDDTLITADYADVVGSGPRFYGVEYSWIDQDQDLYLDRYRRLHGNVVRVQISQEFLEPVNDNEDPDYSEIDFSLTISMDGQLGKTMTYDNMFKSLAAEFPDMYFQINIWLAARWNAADPDGYLGLGGAFPPRDYAEHREFIRALAHWLVDDCGVSPERLSFTLVDEPNLRGFFVGTQADLVRMAEETRTALDQVSPLVQMGGLDEVHGTSWTDEFYRQRPAECCDMWTFHVYERGLASMWNALQERTERLSQYGPVWVTEFADMTNGSPDGKMDFSSREAALEFAELLGRLWPTEIDGIVHFRLSDTYTDLFDLGGWVGHGLFADARGTHSDGQAYEPFPVYWVFANMYRELGGGQVVSTTAPPGLTVVGARKDSETEARLAVWVTNSTTENYTTALRVNNFPARTASVQVFDNLAGDTSIETQVVNGEELTFGVNIPPQSSYLFAVSTSLAQPDLAVVAVSPITACVLPSSTVEFQASGWDGEGNPIGNLTFAWSVANGGGQIVATGTTTLAVRTVVTDSTYASTVVAIANGVSGTASIVVLNIAPLADFSCGACISAEGEPLAFDANASSDPNHDPLTYTWAFGDGSGGSGQTPTHPYPDNGTYTVILTVEDDDAMTATHQHVVTITNVSPAPTITAPGTAASGEAVTFIANANDPGDDTFEYRWDWGDGTGVMITTMAVISHAFTSADVYTITLRVVDDDGGTGETRHFVNVSPGVPDPYCTYLPIILR